MCNFWKVRRIFRHAHHARGKSATGLKVFSLLVTQTAQNPDNNVRLPATVDASRTSKVAGKRHVGQWGKGAIYELTVVKEPK